VAEVHAARDHEIARAGEQLAARVVDGHERAGARRVDRVRAAPQIEPVRDARRREVGHEADGGVRAVGAEIAL
jgi:hypothetical protein